MDQLVPMPFRVVHKLWHWPNAAHSFISKLTNKRPAFCHWQWKLLIGHSGQILASDWSAWSINISEGQKKLSCELTHYLIRTAKETAAEGPRFPDNYQDQEGSRGDIIDGGDRSGDDSGGDDGGGNDGGDIGDSSDSSRTVAEDCRYR